MDSSDESIADSVSSSNSVALVQGGAEPKTDTLGGDEKRMVEKLDGDNTVDPAEREKVSKSHLTLAVQKERCQGNMLPLSNSFVQETATSSDGLDNIPGLVGLQHIRPTSESPLEKVDKHLAGCLASSPREMGPVIHTNW